MDSTAIEEIESLVLSFLTQLVDASSLEPHEKLPAHERRAKSKIQLELAARRNHQSTKTLTYPKKCPTGSVRCMAQLFRVLDLSHEAILEDMPMTKRDIYYSDVQLFKSQRIVDTLIDDIAATFDLGRSSLNIRASSKGLICGSGLTICLNTGEMVKLTDTEGTPIPVGEDIESFQLDEDVTWVLVVEKEAVFQTLCRLIITNHEDLPGRGLLITGKGYPDVATRHLVKTLADCIPPWMPIMALVDADPYGLDILSVYSYGSNAMKHERGRLAAGGRLMWIGVWASEFSRLGIDKDKLLPITKADEKKAFAMLRRSNDAIPLKWKRELQHMLFNRRKAEIEILSNTTEVNDSPPDKNGDRMAIPRNKQKTPTADLSSCSTTTHKENARLHSRSKSISVDIETGHVLPNEPNLNGATPVEHCSKTTNVSQGWSIKTSYRPSILLSGSTDGLAAPRGTRNQLFAYLCRKINDSVEEYT